MRRQTKTAVVSEKLASRSEFMWGCRLHHRPWKTGFVRQRPEILELGRDTVYEGDAGERSLAARLENHARGTLAVDDVIDAEFFYAEELFDVACRHARVGRFRRPLAARL